MDPEQVIYLIREYIKSKDKDLIKLSNYATKMGIKDKVINYIELIYDQLVKYYEKNDIIYLKYK